MSHKHEIVKEELCNVHMHNKCAGDMTSINVWGIEHYQYDTANLVIANRSRVSCAHNITTARR